MELTFQMRKPRPRVIHGSQLKKPRPRSPPASISIPPTKTHVSSCTHGTLKGPQAPEALTLSPPRAPSLQLPGWELPGLAHGSDPSEHALPGGAKARRLRLGWKTICLSQAYLFPATSRTCSSAARDTSAGIRVSLLSRTQNTVRLQQPPIYNRKWNTTVFQAVLGCGVGLEGLVHQMAWKRCTKFCHTTIKSHWWQTMINSNHTKHWVTW